jgi:hypothetical protein
MPFFAYRISEADLLFVVLQRDVDPRHLLRLGSGEKSLLQGKAIGRGTNAAGEEDQFSKQGRVNWSLARRNQLLQQVQIVVNAVACRFDAICLL